MDIYKNLIASLSASVLRSRPFDDINDKNIQGSLESLNAKINNLPLNLTLTTLNLPATTGGVFSDFNRLKDIAGTRTLDSGISSSGAWLQSRDSSDYSTNYPLLLQPNGGDTLIGGSVIVSGSLSAVNFSDNHLNSNVNLGSGNIEGRGLVAGYSGGMYGGIGYNLRHTNTTGLFINPLPDYGSYLTFHNGGLKFFTFPTGLADRVIDISGSTPLLSIARSGNTGIGVESPDRKLVIDGDLGFYYSSNNSYNGIRRDGVSTVYFNNITGVSTAVIHAFTNASDTNVLTITNGGSVSIGPTPGSYLLNIVGNGTLGSCTMSFIDTSNSNKEWRIDQSGGILRFIESGVDTPLVLSSSGANVTGNVVLTGSLTANYATAGRFYSNNAGSDTVDAGANIGFGGYVFWQRGASDTLDGWVYGGGGWNKTVKISHLAMDVTGALSTTGALTVGASGGSDGAISLKRTSDGLTVGTISVDSANSQLDIDTAYTFLQLKTEGVERALLSNAGLAVTGTVSATDRIIATALTASGAEAIKTIARTGSEDAQIAFYASDGSTRHSFFNSYPTGLDWYDDAGALRLRFSSTGLAVTGVASATGQITSSDSVRISKAGSNTFGSGPYLYLSNAAGTAGVVQQLNASNGLDWFNAASGSSPIASLSLVGNLSAIGNVDAGVSLGIGTSGIGGQLNYYGDASGYFEFVNRMGSNKGFRWYTGAGAAVIGMTLDASGNLGLAGAPSAWVAGSKAIEIGTFKGTAFSQATGGDGNITSNAYLSTPSVYAYGVSGVGASRYQFDYGAHYWYTAPIGTAGDAITFTRAMTLDASGNLLTGTTSSAVSNQDAVRITGVGGNASYGANVGIDHGSNGVSGAGFVIFYYNSSNIGSISQSGTTAVAYNTTSDHRLKENIRPADAYRFMDIQFVDFEWVDGRHDCGVIAHQLQSVYPDLVMGEKDATEVRVIEITPAIPAVLDEAGNEVTPAIPAVTEEQTFPVYQQVNHMGLIGRMGTRVQQLQRTTDAQTTQIAAMMVRLDALEAPPPAPN